MLLTTSTGDITVESYEPLDFGERTAKLPRVIYQPNFLAKLPRVIYQPNFLAKLPRVIYQPNFLYFHNKDSSMKLNERKQTFQQAHKPSLKERIQQERLRQASWAFNVALSLTSVITLIGIARLVVGEVSQGAVMTGGGVASSIVIMRMAKDANDRLDRIADDDDDDGPTPSGGNKRA